MQKSILARVLGFALVTAVAQPAAATPELNSLINWAIEHDAGRQQIQYQANSMVDMSVASGQWMDPKLKVGVGGLPVDSFSFNDDPMTKISVGLMQQFGRGDTLELKQKQNNQKASSQREKLGVRELDIKSAITNLWIELTYQQQAHQLLVKNQTLYRELEHYLGTNYGVGANQAQDIIQAQLQISRMDEKLQANEQMQQRLRAQLSEWLGSRAASVTAGKYPQWSALSAYLSAAQDDNYQALASHPSIRVVDEQIKSSQTGIDIAQESYQPQFSVEVMYDYRQANGMNGQPASDLVSAFLTMDLPLFTDKRQDKTLSSAQHQLGAEKSQRDLMLRQMNAKVNALLIDRSNTQQRLTRYNDSLLRRASEKTQAIERGYQNNTSQLDEYIRAASEELTIELEQLRLTADLQLVNSNLAYMLNKF
ncbi:TolC family protein [Photobacterium sp. SDRW27]|uniref:TolC family protein n=1 Tax=Photobacterium obscurum TaxID=2829490 RepID=UPI00224409AC|nr:TolC family protein [Photobacterium obscurum]MCW8327604.1 TolC family protein [Photobacterium obscurum]